MLFRGEVDYIMMSIITFAGATGGLRNLFGSCTSNSNDTSLTFYAPDLPAETLLDRNHNETLAKLNFVLALTDCIVEIAETKCQPLAALLSAEMSPAMAHAPDNCARYDRLVLMMRYVLVLFVCSK